MKIEIIKQSETFTKDDIITEDYVIKLDKKDVIEILSKTIINIKDKDSIIDTLANCVNDLIEVLNKED